MGFNGIEWNLSSGKLTVCYGKLQFYYENQV
jgi:hypothetical protein